MFLRNLFIFIYLIILVVLFGSYEAPWQLWSSFFLSALLLTFITYYHIFIEKKYSPFLSTYIVFNYLFFIVAPIIQSKNFMPLDSPVFDHKFPYKEDLFIKTNLLISLFHIIFFLTYIGVKGYIKTIKKPVLLTKSRSTQVVFRDVFYITVISLILVGIGLPFLIDEYVRHNWTPSSFSPGYQLVFKKIVFSIPIAAIVLCKLIFDKKSISTQTWIINCLVCGAIIFFLFILKNPLVEKRNALGPVYLLLIFLFYPKLVNSNLKTCLLLFVAMIIVFPLTQALTHLQYGITELIENPSLLSAVIDRGDLSKGFMSLNYDAFVNIGIAIEATELNGFSYGFQLLSAFLFFVPRSIWAAKPDASGLVLGNHVIEEYGFNFANLSNPLVSEGYMNFGIPGVAIMAFALALTCLFFLTWLNSNDYLKKATAFYFAIHLLFLLRGDFTNGYSYFVGVFIGIYVIPKLIIKMTGTILDKKVWVNTN